MRNYNLPPEALMRELINTQNTLPFPADDTNLIFGQPSALLDDPRGTTQVKVRGVQDSDYRNRSMAVFYHRLDLGVLFNGTYRPAFTALGQSTLHRLLPDLNKALGIHLTPKDVEDVDVSMLGEGNELTLELRAKPGSLAYTGFTRVVFNRRLVYLTDVITTRIYEELTHPDPKIDGFTSAGLLTWGLDFTLIYPKLEVSARLANWRGNFVHLADLQLALQTDYGIDNWPGNDTTSTTATGTVRDYDTRDVPEANTNFQRVVVQTEIRQNGYVGTAYFHYNRV